MGRKTAAIVLAAGQGKRMNNKVHKQYLLLRQRPVLYYSLKAFEESTIDEIILVAGKGEADYCNREIIVKYGFQKVRAVVEGGKERYHSVYAGLEALSGEEINYVLIHDGARPFVNDAIIRRTIEAVQLYGACVAGMPAKDTIKIANEEAFAQQTPPRDCVWLVQTPQAFEYRLIKQAYDKLMEDEEQILRRGISITDDAMVVELLSDCRVRLVEGAYENIKITTPEDLYVAEAYLDANKY